ISTLAPALRAIEYSPNLFNLSLSHQTIYQGYPTPEIDAAWDLITLNVRPIRISEDITEKIGRLEDPTLVKYPEEDGGGVMASLEVFHQLHCVNMLRKYTYLEYYKSDPLFQSKPHGIRLHLDHCIEMLRTVITCTGDVGVITYDWVKGNDSPSPNFNTMHQCRNFNKIQEWNIQHAVHINASHMTRLKSHIDKLLL
ncbi:hypothetical protein BDQ12DRAFT_606952, partial [Crucibulum laeve]